MFQEFKAFVMRGNVLDMAVGIIIGAAFSKIITSFVGDIFMPPIGVLLGQVDFSSLAYVLVEQTSDKAAVVIGYGQFINTVVDFLIVAFIIFMVIRQVSRFRKPAPVVAPDPTKECGYCFSSIPVRATRCPACTSTL